MFQSIPREKRNVIVLVLVQATAGAQMPIVFIVGGLAGQSLASNVCWATLPISLIVFGSMTTAPWLSTLMQKFGRRTGFWCGCLGGITGGLIGAYALVIESFLLFLVSGYTTGIYMAANGFLRFAAADSASAEFRPKAISYVMAGGLLAAVIGPQFVKLTHDQFVIPFVGTYLVIIGLNLLAALFVLFLDIPLVTGARTVANGVRSYRELLQQPRIVVAIICGMVSYALMNLMMTATPLAVVGCGFTANNAADVVSLHVLAMFAPAFITGHLIARFGAEKVVASGLVLLSLAGITGLSGISLYNFFGALVLLGVGWNFSFIGATDMLISAHHPHERGRVQGMNDMIVFGCVTIASLSSGTLMNCSGGTAASGWQSVNWAMIPFLSLAAISLLWLALFRPRSGRPAGS